MVASITFPTSFRLAQAARGIVEPAANSVAGAVRQFPFATTPLMSGSSDSLQMMMANGGHSMHPNFAHLTLLVFEAVLEVVCVSLPGYIVARQGMFDAEAQKFVANLNVQLFTPCLIFSKLASQLTADKLAELAVIPVIFVVQTFVSYSCSWALNKIFRFKKRPSNFVTAMSVFGNSNSLPISLVLSLSKTLKGLHWDKIPGDNDEEVAARGILYLLIFQQLGQLVRWSWGYNVLLKKKSEYSPSDLGEDDASPAHLEQGEGSDGSSIHDESDPLLIAYHDDPVTHGASSSSSPSEAEFDSGATTPVIRRSYVSVADAGKAPSKPHLETFPTPTNGNFLSPGPGNMAGHHSALRQESANHINTFPTIDGGSAPKRWLRRLTRGIRILHHKVSSRISTTSKRAFESLPQPVQKILGTISFVITKVVQAIWASMNPPLWAMLAALIVASIPSLQALFFTKGSFIENSVTRAVKQSGGVAVPLILVVLGANLARNTLPKEQLSDEDPKIETKLLVASLLGRMLLPTIIMAPLLAVTAKYVPVSILDDPIFVIVCFLLTGAPSALQLAQICQINSVYMGAMSRILFQSYVVWILPSTLFLVMLALEVVEWAKPL